MNRSALFAIIGATIFLLSAGSAFAATPSTATVHIQPNPTMNTNATWSTFRNGWTPLEYNNGTANLTLNTGTSTFYANPISVNPKDIQTSFPKTYDGINLYDKNTWTTGGETAAGSVQTISNTSHSIQIQANESNAGDESQAIVIPIPTSDLPSNNPAYDYFTIGGNITAYTGMEFSPIVRNNTDYTLLEAQNGTPKIFSKNSNPIPGGAQAITSSFWMSASLGQANLTLGTSNDAVGIIYTMPQTTADQSIYININNIAITTEPMTLGTEEINGTQAIIQAVQGNAELTSFTPDFSWSTIANDGYSVAVSQPLQNLTTSQAPITSGSYAEQVEYQGQLLLPTAPDLSYGSANISEHFNLSTSQTQVIDINGVSYLSTISGKNGTITLLSTVNPNQPTQFLQIVDYTESQWTSISSPPGIFSLAGIEYYWEEFIIAILAIVGIAGGAAAKHASNLRRRN